MKVSIETWDNVDMAEYANDSGEPLGTICLEFGTVLDTELDQPGRAAYVESDFLGVGGFFDTVEKALASLAHCIGHQDEGCLSEFVIPAHGETACFLVISVGEKPSEG